MWMAWVPGGNWLTFKSIFTPVAAGVIVAVPILAPLALMMSTWALLGAICPDAAVAHNRAGMTSKCRSDIFETSDLGYLVIPISPAQKQWKGSLGSEISQAGLIRSALFVEPRMECPANAEWRSTGRLSANGRLQVRTTARDYGRCITW